jgi:hypothetical protein
VDWQAIREREEARYRDGEARVGEIDDPDQRQRQLTRMGNAAGGAGLALLMAGRRDQAAAWLERAAARYRESWEDAPPESWGRPIGAIKALLLAGERGGAEDAARWALEAGAESSQSPIGAYAAVLALLVVARDREAAAIADSLRGRDDFPRAVADALAAISSGDGPAYAAAADGVLESFETRDEYLEDVPVADTVLVLQVLAATRGFAAELRESALLPAASN